MVSTNLDGFSLANHRSFTKFANVSSRQSLPPYGIISTYSVYPSSLSKFFALFAALLLVTLTLHSDDAIPMAYKINAH